MHARALQRFGGPAAARPARHLRCGPVSPRPAAYPPRHRLDDTRPSVRRRCHARVLPSHARLFHSSARPQSAPRDAASTGATDLGALDVLGDVPAPSTSIDACLPDGFHLNSGVKVTGGAGVVLVAGEAFAWRPWVVSGRVWDARGAFAVEDERAWGVLKVVWPKPDLLIIGVGAQMRPLSAGTRRRLAEWGIRVEVQDTRNAAAQFNLLATERGVQNVAAAMVPIGMGEGR